MRYDYDSERELFQREDKKGNVFRINISEARRIESLLTLGYGVEKIYAMMEFNEAITLTTCRSFIKNIKNGNINLEGDYPAPSMLVKEFDNESDYTDLERRVKSLEDRMSELKSCECSCKEDPNWKNLWGRL